MRGPIENMQDFPAVASGVCVCVLNPVVMANFFSGEANSDASAVPYLPTYLCVSISVQAE